MFLYVHRNRRLIRDGSTGRPPPLSHSSWALNTGCGKMNIFKMGSGDRSVVKASDSWPKGRGFEYRQELWENSHLRGQPSALTLISVSVSPPCYRSSTEKIQAILPKVQWQVTAKHTCILRMWFRIKWHCKLAHCWMVYTERAPRRQQFLVAPCSKQTVQWLLHWIFKTPCVKEQLLRTFS